MLEILYTKMYTILMTTRTIGIKEFRANMTKLYRLAQKENICFIVMNHQQPVMRVEPLSEDALILEKYLPQIERGLKEVRQGKTVAAEKVYKKLGL